MGDILPNLGELHLAHASQPLGAVVGVAEDELALLHYRQTGFRAMEKTSAHAVAFPKKKHALKISWS